MGELRKRVQETFAQFVGWRLHIIEAFINKDKLFQKTIVVEKERRLLQVELDDELVKLLPKPTMPPNFTSRQVSDMMWIYKLSVYFGAWLESVALEYVGLNKDDRKLLIKEINKLPPICDVCSILGEMNCYVQCGRPGDRDIQCYVCGEVASSVYWKWCSTCKYDELQQYCNSCDSSYNKCQSCGSNFTKVVRCSDDFCCYYVL